MTRVLAVMSAAVVAIAVTAGCSSGGGGGEKDAGSIAQQCQPVNCGACAPTLYVHPVSAQDGGVIVNPVLTADGGTAEGCAPSGGDNVYRCGVQFESAGEKTVTVSAPGFEPETVTGAVELPDAGPVECGCAPCPIGFVDAVLAPAGSGADAGSDGG